jgi:hypothetical protein
MLVLRISLAVIIVHVIIKVMLLADDHALGYLRHTRLAVGHTIYFH